MLEIITDCKKNQKYETFLPLSLNVTPKRARQVSPASKIAALF